jgi:hypothetical protein
MDMRKEKAQETAAYIWIDDPKKYLLQLATVAVLPEFKAWASK